MAPKRSKSSERWLKRQQRDYFARQARTQGQVSRAHYKLEELDRKFHLVRGDAMVLELGAAPGGWTTYIEERMKRGSLVAVDPLPITTGARTQVVEGFAGEPATDEQIDAIVQASERQQFDLVLSDMAPNMSGVRAVDQARSMELADVALNACQRWLGRGGHLALKSFQGEGLDAWVTALRTEFSRVTLTKPKASRAESREVFVVAQGFGKDR